MPQGRVRRAIIKWIRSSDVPVPSQEKKLTEVSFQLYLVINRFSIVSIISTLAIN